MNNEKLFTHVWSIVCSNSLLDKNTNNLSLFNAIEKLSFSISEIDIKKMKEKGAEGIIFPIHFEVISRFIRKEIKGAVAFDYRVSIFNPENKKIIDSERKIGVDKNIKNFRAITNIDTLPVTTSGDYVIVVECKDVGEDRFNRVAELPIEVVINILPEKGSK